MPAGLPLPVALQPGLAAIVTGSAISVEYMAKLDSDTPALAAAKLGTLKKSIRSAGCGRRAS